VEGKGFIAEENSCGRRVEMKWARGSNLRKESCSYENGGSGRLARTQIFNALGRRVNSLVGRPAQREPSSTVHRAQNDA
jgi:hypothetical protein